VTSPRRIAPLAVVPVLLALLAACAPASPTLDATPTVGPSSQPTGEAGCAEVAVVVDFGVLEAPSVAACVAPGGAIEVLAAAGVEVEGTVDYGDQVLCRVAGRPAADETVEVPGADPFVEECLSMPSANAYWALWVRDSAGAEWEYATEGVATLQLAAGQSVGLVYTSGPDQTPPKG
jgi:hypothetical protein